eukprot:2569_1
MATMLLCMIALCSIPTYDAREAFTVDFNNPDQREHKCPRTDGCDYLCRTLRCKNELFHAFTVPKSEQLITEALEASREDLSTMSASGPRTARSTREINVHCEDPLSCIGLIKLQGDNGETRTGASLGRLYLFDGSVQCGTADTQSCTGGIYQFLDFKKALFSGNGQEAIITFKQTKKAMVVVGGTNKKQFFNSVIMTEGVNEFLLDVSAPYGGSGSVVDLAGVGGFFPSGAEESRTSLSTIQCTAMGSCAGMIVMAPSKGGPPIEIECGMGACESMVILLRGSDLYSPKKKTKKRSKKKKEEKSSDRGHHWTHLAITFHISSADTGISTATPNIYILCETNRGSRRACVMQAKVIKGDDPTRHIVDSSFLTHQFNKDQDFQRAIADKLQSLAGAWDAERRTVKDTAAYLMEKDGLGKWAGVSLEAAYGGWLNLPAAGAELGFEGIKGLFLTGYSGIFAYTTAGTLFPLIAPLAIAGVAFLGFRYHQKRKKKRELKKWGISTRFTGTVPSASASSTLTREAREEIGSFYDAYDDEEENAFTSVSECARYLNYEYATDGSVVLYDFFTGKQYSPETMSLQADDQDGDAKDLVEYNGDNVDLGQHAHSEDYQFVFDHSDGKRADFARLRTDDDHTDYDGYMLPVIEEVNSGGAYEKDLVLGGVIGSSAVIVVMLVFYIGFTFGLVVYWGYIQKKALDASKDKDVHMYHQADDQHNIL